MESKKTLSEEKRQRIASEEAALKRTSIAELKNIYRRSHRVCDLRGVRKAELISDLLGCQFGWKTMDTYWDEK